MRSGGFHFSREKTVTELRRLTAVSVPLWQRCAFPEPTVPREAGR